jgi:hypothetical protein
LHDFRRKYFILLVLYKKKSFYFTDDSLLYSDELKPSYFEELEEKDKVIIY